MTWSVRLVDRSDESVPERLELLLAHRRQITEQLHDLEWALAIIDYKINTYGGKAPLS